jgi:HD-GYP domain-containing protein (c-di-GMP phosphodiesterase class II)
VGYLNPSFEGTGGPFVKGPLGDADFRLVTTAAGTLSVELDPEFEAQHSQRREWAKRRLRSRSRRSAVLMLLAFAGATEALLGSVHSARSPSVTTMLALLAAYALASNVKFEVRTVLAYPTQLVLVPMLFALPLSWVPLFVAAGLLLGQTPELVRVSPERALLVAPNALHSLGPVIVLALAGERSPNLHDWPLYLAALGAQFLFDGCAQGAHQWYVEGITPRSLMPSMRWAFLVDTALAPIGLAIAFAADGRPLSVLLVLPLLALLAEFARERRVRIDHALELSHAYRGTALLLGDVVEADDAYTGSHSRDVVTLVLAVCDELGLDARERRDAEFAALLHDVGKIKIPSEIINKPARLDDEERALIETHTVEGERMLTRVGGILANVGRVVRSCHEDWDGTGYPDGLAAEDIPLAARIVRCCDAFSAMTTDRPYRRALPVAVAVAELRRCSGTDFDPVVVNALVAVVEKGSDPVGV